MGERTQLKRRSNLMTAFAHVAPNKEKSIVRAHVFAAATAAVLVFSPAAFAQHQSQFGTADDAKAMLWKVVAAVNADKARALDMFNNGEGGFLDRDLYPFCANVSDGKLVANSPNARQLLGQDVRTLKDTRGKPFGWEQFTAALRPEGELIEVSYLIPNSGVHRTPLLKTTFTTRAGDLVCGVGYYPTATSWTFENPSL